MSNTGIVIVELYKQLVTCFKGTTHLLQEEIEANCRGRSIGIIGFSRVGTKYCSKVWPGINRWTCCVKQGHSLANRAKRDIMIFSNEIVTQSARYTVQSYCSGRVYISVTHTVVYDIKNLKRHIHAVWSGTGIQSDSPLTNMKFELELCYLIPDATS